MILKLLEALFDNVAGPINTQSDKRILDDVRADHKVAHVAARICHCRGIAHPVLRLLFDQVPMHFSELLRIHFFPLVETVNRFIEIL